MPTSNLPTSGPLPSSSIVSTDPGGSAFNPMKVRILVAKPVRRILTGPPQRKDYRLTATVALQNACFDLASSSIRLQTTAPLSFALRNGSALDMTVDGTVYGLSGGGILVVFAAFSVCLEGLALQLNNVADVAVVGEMSHSTGVGTLSVGNATDPEGDQLDDQTAKRSFALRV